MTNNEAIGILAIVVETAKGRCFVTDEAISDAYAMAIKALEAQEWILCTPDTMPENADEVLTTYIVNGNQKKRFVETATWYDGDEECWSSPWDEYRVAGTRKEVIAWKPLPKPYREEE